MPYKFKLGGTIEETGAKNIPLDLNKSNLRYLLKEALTDLSLYTHQDICNWCSIHFRYITVNDVLLKSLNIDEATFEVLHDIDAQWDLFLVDTYSIKQLQTMDLSQVRLPVTWILDWLKDLQ